MAKRKARDPQRTRAEILDVAFRQIYARGFQGVSVRDIVAGTDLTIGAFFHYFATKNDVGYAIIDEIIADGILERWIRPLAAYRNPVQGILKVFRAGFDAWPDENLARGCPLNNLAQEMSAVDPVFRDKAQKVIRMWIDGVEQALRRGQRDGHLAASVDVRALAEFVVTMHEAAFAMSKTLNDRAIIDSLYGALRDHLQMKAGRAA